MKILSYRNVIWSILKLIASLNFSIMLLIVIASISILGTIIEQDQNLLYYQINYPLKDSSSSFIPFSWHTIIFFGLDHLYANWWFLCIVSLFFLSLIICTFSRQLPSLNSARNWKFLQQKKNMKTFHIFRSLYYSSLSNMVYSLHSRHYFIFHKSKSLYAYKGLLGRIAPIFVHVSIILTLIGTIFGLFGGFVVQEMVPNGEIFHMNNVIKSGVQSNLPSDLIGYVKDFYIEKNSNGSIKQFFSSVSLLNSQGHNLVTKQISVNSPLRFNGITFYQTDWKINSLRFRIGNAPIMQRKFNTVKVGSKDVWFCSFPLNIQQTVSIIVTGLQDDILIYDSQGSLVKTCKINQEFKIQNTSLIFKEIMSSTGLQIKVDPGVNIVYVGFFILIISVTISYLSYSQIWVRYINNDIDLAGSTNRALLAFEEDFTAVQKIYTNYTFKDIKI